MKTKTTNKQKVSYEAIEIFDRNNLMEISLLFGVIHLVLSFTRNFRRNIAGFGWCIFLVGGYLYFPKILMATSMMNFLNIIPKETAHYYGFHMIYIGVILAVVFALIQKKKAGIAEITNVVGVFGDVLSYLRLYALGIAGMILSQTFNTMAQEINIFVGVFIVIIGHSINMTLGIMGGIIHGLRLNFLEWYNHCFDGGGKIFNPLKLFK